jgi:hypothetical protein
MRQKRSILIDRHSVHIHDIHIIIMSHTKNIPCHAIYTVLQLSPDPQSPRFAAAHEHLNALCIWFYRTCRPGMHMFVVVLKHMRVHIHVHAQLQGYDHD